MILQIHHNVKLHNLYFFSIFVFLRWPKKEKEYNIAKRKEKRRENRKGKKDVILNQSII